MRAEQAPRTAYYFDTFTVIRVHLFHALKEFSGIPFVKARVRRRLFLGSHKMVELLPCLW